MNIDHDAWRPALAAFYRAEGWPQCAENIERGFPLTPIEEGTIEALRIAIPLAPVEQMLRAA